MKKLLIFMMAILMVMGTGTALTIFNVNIGIPGTQDIYWFSDIPTSFDDGVLRLPNGIKVKPTNPDFKGDGNPPIHVPFDDDEDECEDDEEECEPQPPDEPITPIRLQLFLASDEDTYQCEFGNCEIVDLSIRNMNQDFEEPVYLLVEYHDNGKGEITNIKNYQRVGENVYALDSPFRLPYGTTHYNIDFNAWGDGKFDILVVGANTGEVYAILDPWFDSAFGQRIAFNITSPDTITNFPARIVVDTATLITAGDLQSDCDDLRFTLGETVQVDYWIGEVNGCNNATTEIYIETNLTAATPIEHFMYFDNPLATATSNITETFIFGDDFQDGVQSWDTLSSNITESGGQLRVTVNTFDRNIWAFANFTNSNLTTTQEYIAHLNNCDGNGGADSTHCSSTGLQTNNTSPGKLNIDLGFADVTSRWEKVNRTASTMFTQEATTFGIWSSTGSGSITGFINFYPNVRKVSDSVGPTIVTAVDTYDYVFIRPFISSEPNVSVFGASENPFTSTFDSPVFENTNQTFNLSVETAETEEILSASLFYNNTNISSTADGNTTTEYNFTATTSTPIPALNATGIPVYWVYEVNGTTNTTVNTSLQNDTQSVLFAVFISNFTQELGSFIEGTTFQSNTTVENETNSFNTTQVNLHIGSNFVNSIKEGAINASADLWTGNFNLPQVPDPVLNISFNVTHELVVTYNNTEFSRNFSVNGSADTFKIFLDNCSLTVTPSYRFETFDEDTLDPLTVVDYNNIVSQVTHENSTITRNYSMQNLSADFMQICIYPADAEYIINNSLTYNRENYSQRTYELNDFVIDNSTQVINTFLANETNSFLVTLNVIDGFNLGIPNIEIIIQRFDTINNSFFNVSVVNTNSDGQAFANLILNDVTYNFILNQAGDTKLIESTILTGLSKTFQIIDRPQLVVGILLTITQQCTYDNSTNILQCIYNDSSDQLQNATLIATGINISGIKNQFCLETNTSTNGILTCNISTAVTQNVSEVEFVLNVFIEDFEYELARGIIILQDITNTFGVTGLLAALLLILTMSLIGINHPVTTVGGAIIGVIASSILGLIPIQASFIVGLVIVGIILIIKMRN